MTNLLRKIEEISYQPETVMMQMNFAQLKSEVFDNIEELTKEVSYLKDKVKILIASANDEDELTDTIFKLRDLKHSLEFRKQSWESLISHRDGAIKLEIDRAMDMLHSTTEKLEMLLEETMAYQKAE